MRKYLRMSIFCRTFAPAFEKNGRLDERLSQRSAKPFRAV